MNTKYELIAEKTITAFGKKLFKIRALADIESIGVKKGDEGGYIEAEKNLSVTGNAYSARRPSLPARTARSAFAADASSAIWTSSARR